MQKLKFLITKPEITLLNQEIKTVKRVPYYLAGIKATCHLSSLRYIWAVKNKGTIQLSIHPSSGCQHSELDLKLLRQPVHLCLFSPSLMLLFWTTFSPCVQDISLSHFSFYMDQTVAALKCSSVHFPCFVGIVILLFFNSYIPSSLHAFLSATFSWCNKTYI